MSTRKISIVVPAYNMAHTLPIAIKSVLSQTFKDFELIIVDDGSDDNTRDVVADFLAGNKRGDPRISYLYQENKGRGGALNTGIKASTGAYITFLDADDILTDNSLLVRIEALDENPLVGMVYADAYYTDRSQRVYKTRRSKGFSNKKDLFRNLLSYPTTPIIGPTIMVRREVFQKVGFYNTIYRRNQDQEMHIRIVSEYDVLYVPEPVLYYRTYLRRSKILKYKIQSIQSWYVIADNYVKRRGYRLLLKMKRTLFELMKLFYEFISYKK